MRDASSDVVRQGAFSRAMNSIRTRFSLLTTFFLLAGLVVFYAGGRIVLVHLVRDAEQQVRSFGFDVSRSAYRNADCLQNAARAALDRRPDRSHDVFSEAMEFYSGGFWRLDANPFEAVYAIRDSAGDTVSMARVTIPESFVSITKVALDRLSFFIAIGGILFVIPLFWLQGRILLNPLSRMTREVARIGEHNADTDCPRLDWKGKDEFAQLAVSVNRMLETISRRSIAVAQTEARHQALIDCLPDALAIFDPVGRLVAFSKEAEGVPPLPGFAPGEAPDAKVFGNDSVVEFLGMLGETFRTGKVGRTRLKVQRPAGVPRSVPTRHFELRAMKMDEYFALAVIRDTTEEVAEHKRRLAAEERMSDVKKRESLTLLAAGIAHDMNNVLSVVLGAAEAAKASSPAEAEKSLGVIRDAVRRGAAMMRELRTFAGETRIALMRMSANVLLDDVKVLSERTVGGNVSVSFACNADVPYVDADPNQFWKVVFNIIKNAGEAIGARLGHISVAVSRCEMTRDMALQFTSEKPLPPGVGALFTISDNGPGIRAELIPRLFDPYVSSKASGRGLGLATVRTIVEAHGGGISVQSELERGTTFLIYLPESRLSDEPAAAAAAPAGEKGNLAGEVLVVDDEDSIRRTTSILLRALKLTPHGAKDAQEALAVVRRRAASLRAIVLDAHLGAGDASRLVATFRESAPNVPVIVSTGSAEEHVRKQFADAPYDAFLAKPYTFEELRAAIENARRTA